MKEFGERIDNNDYIVREGAYGIIIDEKKIGVISVREIHTLVGGAIENDESPLSCLKREIVEETGYSSSSEVFLETCVQYAYSKRSGKYYKFIAHVYTCKLGDYVNEHSEDDHELVWYEAKEIASQMLHDYQKDVIKRYIINEEELDD